MKPYPEWSPALWLIFLVAATCGLYADPRSLQPGSHLLVDDFLIASSSNVVRRPVTLERTALSEAPVITSEQHQSFQPFFTILRDAASGRFRIWYGIPSEDFSHVRSRIAYMESDDGIHWTNAHRILEVGPIQFGSSVIDSGTRFLEAERRYKLAWHMDNGLKMATSPDGLKWKPLTANVLIPHSHDINGIFFDPLRNRTVAILSFFETGPTWNGQRRITKQSTTTNLHDWTEPKPILTPDARDKGDTQFYAMDGFLTRGDLMLGMVKVLRDDLKADNPPAPPEAYGIGYTTVAWTRDGINWNRERIPFLDRNPTKGTWDHAHAWIDEQVPVGDEVYLYYAGYKSGHKVNRFQERQIGLIKMKRDRYVGYQAIDRGTLQTKPLLLKGERLFVNATATGGQLRVQLLTPEGKTIRGFTAEDCVPIRSDSVAAAVEWKNSRKAFPAEPVLLQFLLDKATLFAMELR